MTKQYVDKELLNDLIVGFKTLREQQKVTLETFYFDTGIHLARIEQGETNITVSTLAQICRYFNISLKDFFALVEELKSNRSEEHTSELQSRENLVCRLL